MKIQVLTVEDQPIFEHDEVWVAAEIDAAVAKRYGFQSSGLPHNWCVIEEGGERWVEK